MLLSHVLSKICTHCQHVLRNCEGCTDVKMIFYWPITVYKLLWVDWVMVSIVTTTVWPFVRESIITYTMDNYCVDIYIMKRRKFGQIWLMLLYEFYHLALILKGYLIACMHLFFSLSLRLSVCPSVHLCDEAYPCNNLENVFQIFLKIGWNTIWVNILDKFNDGYCSSLDMCIIDPNEILIFLIPDIIV